MAFFALATLPLLATLAAAAPAQTAGLAPVAAAPSPATTAGPSTTDAIQGAIITPQITYGSTVINGKSYPVVGGSIGGGYRFSGSSYFVTGYLGGFLYNCYNQIGGTVEPALCFGGDELDTEVLALGGFTLYDGGLPHASTDVAFTGKLPGPVSGLAGGVVGIPGTAVFGGAASGVFTPALNSGDKANGGAGAAGSVTLGPASFGGQAGGSFVTMTGYTSYGAGAVGSVYVGPLGGAGTIGGDVVGTTAVGCAGLNADGVGYTACVTA